MRTFGYDDIYNANSFYAGYNSKIETPLLETLDVDVSRVLPPAKAQEKTKKKRKIDDASKS